MTAVCVPISEVATFWCIIILNCFALVKFKSEFLKSELAGNRQKKRLHLKHLKSCAVLCSFNNKSFTKSLPFLIYMCTKM